MSCGKAHAFVVGECLSCELATLRQQLAAAEERVRGLEGLLKDNRVCLKEHLDAFIAVSQKLHTAEQSLTEALRDMAMVQEAVKVAQRERDEARADLEPFKKAVAHIEGDRIGSYSICGKWTMIADLTPEEVNMHHYREARRAGAEWMRERAAGVCDGRERDTRTRLSSDSQAATAYLCAAEIRALPLNEKE